LLLSFVWLHDKGPGVGVKKVDGHLLPGAITAHASIK
jgi:hypothetical protein